jgi:hypothetical protein
MKTPVHKPVTSPLSAPKAVFSPQRFLQRRCACGGQAGTEAECEECRQEREGNLQRKASGGSDADVGHDFGQVSVVPASGLQVNQPGDVFEQEADRVADAVMAGQTVSAQACALGTALQRDDAEPQTGPTTEKPKSEAEKYQDAALKLSEALRATDAGKKLEAEVIQQGKDFVSTPEGKAVAGTALAGALAAIIATNKELPVQLPEIPLDWLASGFKAKLTWEGPVRTPTHVGLTITAGSGVSIGADYSNTPASPGKPAEQKAGLTITIPLGGPEKKKSGPAESEKYQAETARLKAEQDKIQEASKTPEQRAEDKRFWDAYWRSKIDDPLNPGKRRKTGDDLLLMRKAVDAAPEMAAPPLVNEVLAGSGSPLDVATRGFMESRFHYDFGQVRVHADSRAAESANAVNAAAYTVGRQVVFGAGRYAPETTAGRKLLAHELTHVIQQSGGAHLAGNTKLVQRARLPCTSRKNLDVYAVSLPGATRNVSSDLPNANSILCQCGLALNLVGGESWQTDLLDRLPPKGVLNEYSAPGSPSAEEVELLSHQPGGKALHLYYVPSLSGGSEAESFWTSGFPTVNNGVAISNGARACAVAHEIGHVLLNDGSHHSNKDNLMAPGSTNTCAGELEQSQCDRMPV